MKPPPAGLVRAGRSGQAGGAIETPPNPMGLYPDTDPSGPPIEGRMGLYPDTDPSDWGGRSGWGGSFWHPLGGQKRPRKHLRFTPFLAFLIARDPPRRFWHKTPQTRPGKLAPGLFGTSWGPKKGPKVCGCSLPMRSVCCRPEAKTAIQLKSSLDRGPAERLRL